MTTEYRVKTNLDLYDSPVCTRLATQASAGRYLRVIKLPQDSSDRALIVYLREDDYPAWLATADVKLLEVATSPYQAPTVSEIEVQARIPQVIDFIQQAASQPNTYLWGGTVGPNFDCSGLMQAAFASVEIWLPRDAYQQEDFLQSIEFEDLQPGDLVFFGTLEKATHVGLYLDEGRYIHSSGQQGRNGIGIDSLVELTDPISQSYYQQLRGYGRVVASYQPTGEPYRLNCSAPPSSISQ
jgi:cell wall-associated NlpC family hydrolase